MVPVVGFLLRNSPADVGLLPYGADESYESPVVAGNPVRAAFDALSDARRDGIFWLRWGSFFVCGLTTTGLVQTHFISAAHDHAIGAASAAGYLALIGGFDVLGTIGSGWLTDKWDPAKLLVVYYGLRGVSLLFLDPALTRGGGGLIVFMVFYGLDWVATVPPTVSLCVQRFGAQRGPLVYGWVFFGHQAGGALAAWGAGWLRDGTGSYRSAFFIAGMASMVAAVGASRMTRTRMIVPTGPVTV